jgi:hypothetical protein
MMFSCFSRFENVVLRNSSITKEPGPVERQSKDCRPAEWLANFFYKVTDRDENEREKRKTKLLLALHQHWFLEGLYGKSLNTS